MKRIAPNNKLQDKREYLEQAIYREAEWNPENWNPNAPDFLNDSHESRDGMGAEGYSMHLTNDNWSPNFDYGLIASKVYPTNESGSLVIFRGADDTMLERRFVSYEEAREFIKRLPILISKEYLLMHRFQ
jgi:hypothetical protein